MYIYEAFLSILKGGNLSKHPKNKMILWECLNLSIFWDTVLDGQKELPDLAPTALTATTEMLSFVWMYKVSEMQIYGKY